MVQRQNDDPYVDALEDLLKVLEANDPLDVDMFLVRIQIDRLIQKHKEKF